MPVTLSDFIMSYAPATGSELHLVHCTSAGASIQILADRILSPTKCPVYGDHLLYLFYGRPAYKPGAGSAASGIVELAPVCLVLDPALLATAVRLLPFDSGGFSRYEPLLGPSLKLPEFELGNDPSAPLRLVRAFYETNANYYDQIPALEEKTLPLSRLTPRAYARLIADPSIRAMDDRCGTIEVQFSTTISLKSALRAIVGPNALFDDPEVKAALVDCPDAVALPYKTYGRSEPDNFAHALYERVETFLRDHGGFL
ncbi:hypothetical protein MESS2_1080011 [Mesorhizobium metallidurans STM 2683]|uniref:Uncharacterized protein n=1 Tax=Mesorhizobium metallidurans STM 2683 TaxID=1297569 RepID=M5EUX2_9HYPH|nr:hypothetical protein [Mesorhizobium metallidurans]CCV03511.1 hypothetical protein MESS2_1080011 [Mesorhizobium metallidurans STM 2683]